MICRLICWMGASALLFGANVTNVEFHFSPFQGDVAKADRVKIVAGKARVLINGLLIAEREVRASEAPVLFEERQIGGPIWITGQSLGPSLRKQGNLLRIEFEPATAGLAYQTQLRWAFVSDGSTEKVEGNKHTSTNMTGEGKEEKAAQGKFSVEKAFDADFAPERPWHQYPAVMALSEEDRAALAALVQKRLDAYQPNFAQAYALLQSDPRVDIAEMRELRCVEKAYQAGMRVKGPAAGQLVVTLSGKAEVLLQAKGAPLFQPADPNFFPKVKDQSLMRCMIPVLEVLFPERLLAAKNPNGTWEEAH